MKPKASVAPKANPDPERETMAAGDGGKDGIAAPVVVMDAQAPRVPVVKVKPTRERKGKAGRKGKAMVGKDGKGEGESEGEGMPSFHPSVSHKKKPGPMAGEITESAWARVVQAVSLGLAADKWWGVSGVGEQRFRRILARDAWRRDALRAAAISGEVDMQIVVQSCQPGWQGSAWLLERTRGYVARHGVEHSGPNGRPLSVVAQVFTTLEAPGK